MNNGSKINNDEESTVIKIILMIIFIIVINIIAVIIMDITRVFSFTKKKNCCVALKKLEENCIQQTEGIEDNYYIC